MNEKKLQELTWFFVCYEIYISNDFVKNKTQQGKLFYRYSQSWFKQFQIPLGQNVTKICINSQQPWASSLQLASTVNKTLQMPIFTHVDTAYSFFHLNSPLL